MPELEWADQEWERPNTLALPWCGWAGAQKRLLPLFTFHLGTKPFIARI